MAPLAVMFGIIAAFGLFAAIMGHVDKASDPTIGANTLSLPGYAVFIVCGLMSLAAAAS